MSGNYILDEQGEPTPVDVLTWAQWFKTNQDKRIVQQDQIGDVRVSTVFLGLDHSFGGVTPILWETMVFGGPHDDHQERYTSRADAVAGHARALAIVVTP